MPRKYNKITDVFDENKKQEKEVNDQIDTYKENLKKQFKERIKDLPENFSYSDLEDYPTIFKEIAMANNCTEEQLKEYLSEDVNSVEDKIEDSIENIPGSENVDVKDAAKEVEKAEKQLDDVSTVYVEGDIEEELNDALAVARQQRKFGTKHFTNVLLVGGAGTGKTARIEAWAKHHGIKLFAQDAKSLDQLDFGVALPDEKDHKLVRYGSKEYDDMNEGEWILFLDEYNRAKPHIRGTLLTLVNDHKIQDPESPTKMRELKGLLFTVAAINPFTSSFDQGVTPLDPAERSRWSKLDVVQDPSYTLEYLEKDFNNQLAKAADDAEMTRIINNRKALAQKLLKDDRLHFDTIQEIEDGDIPQDQIYNPRSLTNLLNAVKDKDSLLKKWPRYCNPTKLKLVKTILADFVDIDDKANSVFSTYDSQSSVASGFAKRPQGIGSKFKQRIENNLSN